MSSLKALTSVASSFIPMHIRLMLPMWGAPHKYLHRSAGWILASSSMGIESVISLLSGSGFGSGRVRRMSAGHTVGGPPH